VVGAYFLIRKEVTDQIGFLDERYFLYFEEIDFCLRAQRAGWEVLFYPDAQVIHLGGQSSSTTKRPMTRAGKQLIHFRVKSELRYYRKNCGLLTMLASAGVELSWKAVIFLKNLIIPGRYAAIKRREAAATINIIIKMLVEDRLGKGIIP